MAFQIPIEHLPPGYAVYGALYTEVANAAFLHSQLLARNAEFEYALIDASTLLSSAQVLAAVFKAVWAAHTGSLKTPNVHSETVLGLSPSLNIAEAYRRYGIAPESRSVVVVKIIKSEDANAAKEHLKKNVEGTCVPLTDEVVAKCTDFGKVKKYYKLNGVPSLASAGKDKDALTSEKLREAETLALGAMALRGL